MLIETPISVGELIDKITILQIKKIQIKDAEKLKHISTELNALIKIITEHKLDTPDVQALSTELKAVNQTLWDIEDDIRLCEKQQDFSNKFTQLARNVYITNDKRAEIKRKINELTGSALCEVKSYETY